MKGAHVVVSALAVVLGLALSLAFAAKALELGEEPLTEKQVKNMLKENKRLLERAKEAQRRGDTATVEQNVAQYTANARELNEALARGQVEEADTIDVVERVDKATLKHVSVLEGLLEKVPEQARPGIERALEVSQRGHDAATQALTSHARVELGNEALTDRAAKAAVKKNEMLLEHAKNAQKRGDSEAVQQAVEQYTRNTEQLNQAIENGRVDAAEAVSVLERVDAATRKHQAVLEGLLGKVPEQARPGIERAMEKSRQGNIAATEALARTPAGARRTGRPAEVGRPGTGRPDVGGPPAGGPPRPGGPPAGGPPKPPGPPRPPR